MAHNAVQLTLHPKLFLGYKFLNSLFLGLSIGAVFTLYAPLQPSIFTAGGIALAVGMLVVARVYHYIINISWFYRISLLVEWVILIAMVYFLFYPYQLNSALLLYASYQFTFVFGNYLVRTETLLMPTQAQLTALDTAKQSGYLLGMAMAYLFYEILRHKGIESNKDQVFYLHYGLIMLQIVIIVVLLLSFKKHRYTI